MPCRHISLGRGNERLPRWLDGRLLMRHLEALQGHAAEMDILPADNNNDNDNNKYCYNNVYYLTILIIVIIIVVMIILLRRLISDRGMLLPVEVRCYLFKDVLHVVPCQYYHHYHVYWYTYAQPYLSLSLSLSIYIYIYSYSD